MRTALLPLAALLWIASPAPAKEAPLKTGKVHPIVTKKHDRAWSLFVPSKYSKKKSWPLVISSHGRGGSGKGEMRPWQGLANRFGFIVACPDMVTATNNRPKKSNLSPSQEDDEVLMEIFETVCSKYRVNRRAVMITGFSGGGNPSYHSGLRHPEVFTHICTRGGNFAPQQIPGDSKVVEAGKKHLKIYIFFGDRDHVLIIGDQGNNGQAHAARDALKNAGYENIEFERVPGMGHQSRPQKAAEWLSAWLEANKKQLKAADKVDRLLEKAQTAFDKKKYKDAAKHVLKAKEEETKHELRPLSKKLYDEINEVGKGMLAEATKQKEAGELKAALKIATTVARDFKGLPAGAAAKELQQAWKQ